MTPTADTLPTADHLPRSKRPNSGPRPAATTTFRLACTLADMAIDLVYLGLMAFVFARPHRRLAGQLSRRSPASNRCSGCSRCSAS